MTALALVLSALIMGRSPGGALADGFSPAQIPALGFDQHLQQQVPPDISFETDRGEMVRIGDYFGDKPIVLTLNYFSCSTLCPLILESMSAFSHSDLKIGGDFTLLTVSIDPRDSPATAAPLKAREVMQYGHPEIADGWHFLTGDADAIARLTQAVGYKYAYDEKQGQFAHPAGIVVLSPSGKIWRYLYGIDFAPTDLRLALNEASNGKVGTPFDQLVLLCYHYDPSIGRYSSIAMTGVRAGGAVTAVALGWFLFAMWRKELRGGGPGDRPPPAGPEAGTAASGTASGPGGAR